MAPEWPAAGHRSPADESGGGGKPPTAAVSQVAPFRPVGQYRKRATELWNEVAMRATSSRAGSSRDWMPPSPGSSATCWSDYSGNLESLTFRAAGPLQRLVETVTVNFGVWVATAVGPTSRASVGL